MSPLPPATCCSTSTSVAERRWGGDPFPSLERSSPAGPMVVPCRGPACTGRLEGDVDTWARYDAERQALCDDLAGLEESRWDIQSLCSQWKVRHVVAHLVAGADVKAGPM